MNPPPLSLRLRILILAIAAIAWVAATRDSPNEMGVQANVATPASQVVATGKTNDGDHR